MLAIDNSKPCLEILKSQHPKAIASGQLTVQESDVATFEPTEPADLVLAADIFQYSDPAKFKELWKKIHDTCLKEGGFLVGSFFRAPVDDSQLQAVNMLKEMGAWFLPDRRMVRALLTQTGYQVETCRFRDDGQKDPTCIQFIAKKVGSLKA